jgi:hypothetical protein
MVSLDTVHRRQQAVNYFATDGIAFFRAVKADIRHTIVYFE